VDVLRRLNRGADQTVNLMEVIAVDQSRLIKALFPAASHREQQIQSPRLLERMVAGADILIAALGTDIWDAAPTWTSDIARGWAAMAVGRLREAPLDERLRLALPFALDPHFAVREWAWLGVRSHIAADTRRALRILADVADHRSPYARRFACEATRPIGVWSQHITTLRRDPSPALPLLERLRADQAKYVRLSFGNWLNDASRDNPSWVRDICHAWSLQDASPDVYRRATRTLRRRGTEVKPAPTL